MLFYSTFEKNYGSNGIFVIAYFPLVFSGNTTFSGNRLTDSLKVYIYNINNNVAVLLTVTVPIIFIAMFNNNFAVVMKLRIIIV